MSFILFGCNSSHENVNKFEIENNSIDNCFTYPSRIDSLKVTDLYDSARWFLYTYHCDQFYKSKKDSSFNKSFGELELKFNNIFIKNDTAEFFFDFIDNGEPILLSMMRVYKPLVNGVGFDVNKREKIYMIASNISFSNKGNPKNKYVNPLQPEVLNYIKSNWNKLNECFRALAKQKGISK